MVKHGRITGRVELQVVVVVAGRGGGVGQESGRRTARKSVVVEEVWSSVDKNKTGGVVRRLSEEGQVSCSGRVEWTLLV